MQDTSWKEISELIVFSIISVVSLFIISKLLGKKQISQLNFIDYVLGISIGSIAANMATDTSDHPFYFYLVGMVIFFLVAWLIDIIGRKSPKLKSFFNGNPVVIIYDGKLNYKALKQTKLDVNDIISLCRDKNYFDINDIAFAIFENSGKLSIMPKGNMTPVTIEDISKVHKPASLPNYLVVDGRISRSGLNEINKDVDWLLKNLKLKTQKELKQFILVSYNNETKKIVTHLR